MTCKAFFCDLYIPLIHSFAVLGVVFWFGKWKHSQRKICRLSKHTHARTHIFNRKIATNKRDMFHQHEGGIRYNVKRFSRECVQLRHIVSCRPHIFSEMQWLLSWTRRFLAKLVEKKCGCNEFRCQKKESLFVLFRNIYFIWKCRNAGVIDGVDLRKLVCRYSLTLCDRLWGLFRYVSACTPRQPRCAKCKKGKRNICSMFMRTVTPLNFTVR